jgi:RHS repeat-associated protein
MDAYTNFLGASQDWNSNVALNDYKERVSYDANGNILTYLRHGTTLNSKPLKMDSLFYNYYAGTNQLRQVRDSVNAANYTEDIDDQSDTSNYVYDAIGNLINDKAESIDSIKWNVYGKIMSIHKSSGLNIWYTYDAGGNRISKKVKNGSDSTYTWYARDASGNVLSVYRIKNDTTYQDELHLYGSNRIGMIRPERNLILAKQFGDTSGTFDLGTWRGNVYRRGQKFFELANHLGNVLVTTTDKKLGIDINGDSTVNYYMPDVATANDYYPFGMGMPGRKFSLSSAYRYGFNGKENDNDVKGEGNQQDYGMRIYDPRLGKFLSVDPLTRDYPWYTPYQFAGNTPIQAIDIDGAEPGKHFIYVLEQGKPKLIYSASRSDGKEGNIYSLETECRTYTSDAYYTSDGILNFLKKLHDPDLGKLVQNGFFEGSRANTIFPDFDKITSIEKLYEKVESGREGDEAMANPPVNWWNGSYEEQAYNFNQITGGAYMGLAGALYNTKTLGGTTSTNTNQQAVRANGGNTNAAKVNTARQKIWVQQTEPQVGSNFGVKKYAVKNGIIEINGQAASGQFDFVVTNNGKFVIGSGHYNISGSAKTVQAAGRVFISAGKIITINNRSGHYQPSMDHAQRFGEIIKRAGINVSGANLEIYNKSSRKVQVKTL